MLFDFVLFSFTLDVANVPVALSQLMTPQRAKIQSKKAKPAPKAAAKIAKTSAKSKVKPVKASGAASAVKKGLAKMASTAKALTKKATDLAKPAVKAAPVKGASVKAAKTPAAPVLVGKKGAPIIAQVQVKQKKGVSAYSPLAGLNLGRGAHKGAVSEEAVCREVACEGLSTTGGYCRMHYIKNWKKIKRKEIILKEKKLNQYIEELVAKYPDKYIEAIRQDLASEKDFAKVITDLDLDEGIDDFEGEGENAENFIDTIRRDFDDEGEGF